MKALEKALTTNITPLLRFSALKDFSGENISFLKHIHEWKSTWTSAASHPTPPARFPSIKKSRQSPPPLPLLDAASLRRHQFTFAVEIFVSFISPQYSDFPINISYVQFKDLESIFSHAASTLNARTQGNTATPFDTFVFAPPRDDIEHHAGHHSGDAREKDSISIASTAVNPISSPLSITTNPFDLTVNNNSNKTCTNTTIPNPLPPSTLLDLQPRLGREVAVPLAFGPHVFDEAERAVKSLVLTNTWHRFVADGFASQRLRESESVRRNGMGRARTAEKVNDGGTGEKRWW